MYYMCRMQEDECEVNKYYSFSLKFTVSCYRNTLTCGVWLGKKLYLDKNESPSRRFHCIRNILGHCGNFLNRPSQESIVKPMLRMFLGNLRAFMDTWSYSSKQQAILETESNPLCKWDFMVSKLVMTLISWCWISLVWIHLTYFMDCNKELLVWRVPIKGNSHTWLCCL